MQTRVAIIMVAHLFPRMVNRRLIAATRRYTSPVGTSAMVDAGHDLRALSLTAGLAATAAAATAIGA